MATVGWIETYMERINLATNMFFSLGTLGPYVETRCLGKIGSLSIETNGRVGDDAIEIYGVHYNNRTRKVVFNVTLSQVGCKANDVYTVSDSIVSKRYQGFSIMAKVYRLIILKLKIKLQAGSMQSVGGRGIWVRLNKLKGIEITGYSALRSKVAYDMVDGGEGELVTECGLSPYDKNSFTMIAEAV